MRRHQPFYCEENVYWLLQDEALVGGAPHAVFITNLVRRCRFMHQRASPEGQPTWWDYHVVAHAHGQIWDLDTRLPMPMHAGAYLKATFPLRDPTMTFRVVSAADLFATFTTDRSHMRGADGSYVQAPPPWAPPTAPGYDMNLYRFLDAGDAAIAGVVFDEAGLQRWIDR